MSVDEKFLHALARMAFYERSMRVVQVTQPAAATDWSVTVPGGKVWAPLAFTATFVTDANVANRDLSLQIGDQTNLLAAFDAVANQAAGQTNVVTYCTGGGLGAGGTTHGTSTTPIPDLALPAGFTISSHTTNLQVGDQWSNIVCWVEELDAQPRGVYEVRHAMQEYFLDSGSYAAEGGMQ